MKGRRETERGGREEKRSGRGKIMLIQTLKEHLINARIHMA